MFALLMQVATAIGLAGFIVAVVRASIRPGRFPPGPPSLPLLGYVPFLDVRNLARSFNRLSRRYGDVFSIFLGTTPCVIINSYPLIKEAFEKKEFSGRPDIYSGTFFQKGRSGVSTTEGPHWETQRAFFHEHMIEQARGKGSVGFRDVIMDEVYELQRELSKVVGEAVPISYQLNVSIINILWTLASGRRLHAQQQEFMTVYDCIDKITQFMSRAAIMSFMPFLARIVPERISRMEKGRYHRDRFLAISKKWIREHKEDYRGNRTGDFQDSYLEKAENGVESFSEEGLGAILREMFVIGAESQSVTLRWAIRILSVHRDVQRKIQDEMDEIVSSRNDHVTWDMRDKMPYTRAAIAEIQRYADITPTGIGHKTLCDVDFRGFHIPKGTHVLSNITACHRSKLYWKNPDKFDPNHFLGNDGNFIEDKEGFVPFGVGLRRCPGEAIAEMKIFLILANLLKTFTLKTPPEDKGLIGTQYESGTGFIRNPKPYKVVLHNRE